MKRPHLPAADRLTFVLSGPRPQQALNLAAQSGIRLFHIRPTEAGFRAQIAGVDWPRMQQLAKSGPWTLQTLRRRGPGRLLERLALRPGILAGIVWCAALTAFLNGFVWTIQFGNLNNEEQYQMRSLLAAQKIEEGTRLTKAALTSAQAAALQQSDRFGWISLNFTGGCLSIENTETEHQTIREEPSPTALYAAAAGTITAVEAESGFCAVTVGQPVQKGDLLVDLQRLDRKGNPVRQGAAGKIIARVEQTYTTLQPYRVSAKVYTGRSSECQCWHLLGKERYREEPEENYTGPITDVWTPLRLGRMTLPGVVRTVTRWEQKTVPLHYSPETAQAMAQRQCRQQLYKDFPDAVIEAERRSVMAAETAAECTVTYIFRANIAQPG